MFQSFVPRFEEVFKKAIEEYQEVIFEDEVYPFSNCELNIEVEQDG